VDSSCVGVVWGLFAFLLGHRALGATIWGGVLASPLLGLGVGLVIHPRYAVGTGWRRTAWVLAGVYAGAAGFGLAVAGYLLILGPLAWFTHWVIEWRLGE
jgi:hypothetical protein